MGEINISSIPIDILLNLLNIVLLFVLVRSLVYKPVRKFMDARTARVNAAAQDAADKAAEADARQAEYEQKLADADARCASMLASSKQDAQREAAQILSDAREEADRILTDAQAEARREREEALQGMQSEIVDLAFGISEKLLSRSIRDADNEKLADRLFDSCTGGETSE